MRSAWAQDLLDEIEKGFEDGLKDGVREGVVLSSGSLSYGDLKSLDHPYARRHGMPLLPPEYINHHPGGTFRDAWEKRGPRWQGDDLVGSVENHDPVADYLTQPSGAPKSKMFARPIDKLVEAGMIDDIEIRVNQRVAGFARRTYNV
jgi:hypothetical protein